MLLFMVKIISNPFLPHIMKFHKSTLMVHYEDRNDFNGPKKKRIVNAIMRDTPLLLQQPYSEKSCIPLCPSGKRAGPVLATARTSHHFEKVNRHLAGGVQFHHCARLAVDAVDLLRVELEARDLRCRLR